MGSIGIASNAGYGRWGADTATANTLRRMPTSSVKSEICLEEEIRREANSEGIVGQSPALLEVLQHVEMVAASDTTVLLLGETGTGKELAS